MRGIKFIVSSIIIIAVVGYINPPDTIAGQAEENIQQAGQLAEGPRGEVDEEALAILKKATDYLTGLKQFTLKAVLVEDVVQESGQKLQFSSTLKAFAKRPSRLCGSRVRDDGSIRRIWYDGKTFTLYDESENVFGQIPVPGTIDKMLDYLETIVRDPRPLADFFYNDLSYLVDLPLSGMYAGISYLDGTACDHLAFRGGTLDWQFWVDRGEKPLFRKIVITYRELPGEPQFMANIVEWDTQPRLSDDLFHFIPPEGARRIHILVPKQKEREEGGAQ